MGHGRGWSGGAGRGRLQPILPPPCVMIFPATASQSQFLPCCGVMSWGVAPESPLSMSDMLVNSLSRTQELESGPQGWPSTFQKPRKEYRAPGRCFHSQGRGWRGLGTWSLQRQCVGTVCPWADRDWTGRLPSTSLSVGIFLLLPS